MFCNTVIYSVTACDVLNQDHNLKVVGSNLSTKDLEGAKNFHLLDFAPVADFLEYFKKFIDVPFTGKTQGSQIGICD